jgi:hypothetical protein
MRFYRLAPAWAVALSLANLSCLQSDSDAVPAVSGPFDGTYTLVSRTCGGSSLTVQGTISRFVVKGPQGVYSDDLIDNCVIVSVAALSYPSPGTVVSQTRKVTCSTACSGAECDQTLALQPSRSYSYSIQGSSLILTQAGAHAGCASSEVAAFQR